MFKIFEESCDFGGDKLILETGKMARQANGSVIARYGDTVVLATAVAHREAQEGQGFFPLTVNYQEKLYAAGRIPGGFLKREGRPSEKETLSSRLIDRPIRPLFPDNFLNETQVVCTVLSHDGQTDAAIIALIAASAALSISDIPFQGPIGAAKVGYINGEYVLNPTAEQLTSSKLELVVAGTKDGVLMVESEAHMLSEEQMLEAVFYGHTAYQTVIETINRLTQKCGKTKWVVTGKPEEYHTIYTYIQENFSASVSSAFAHTNKLERRQALHQIENDVQHALAERYGEAAHTFFGLISEAYHDYCKAYLRSLLLETSTRIDGRSPETVRPIQCEVGILPRTHGSALFTRGETQALAAATLGTGSDEQIVDGLHGEYRDRFLLHYNFPPFSVGEVGRLGTPGRREIGHGKLARRALEAALPSFEEFSYTIRAVSEVLESNGSSSMATVCATSLALMDAGVPMQAAVSGIAMGLIKEGSQAVILSDISGDEDHLGDMDFKVAGSVDGISALQMDLKITSIDKEIMKSALAQAKQGRLHILEVMQKTLQEHRPTLSDFAPKLVSFSIAKDKIREVIGAGGKIIREIIEKFGVKVDINDDGLVSISSQEGKSIEAAKAHIMNIVAEPEIGKIYEGTVVKIAEFGAFVDFLNSSGLIHISELSPERVKQVTDVVKLGDVVRFKVINIDERGRVRLSIKAVEEEA